MEERGQSKRSERTALPGRRQRFFRQSPAAGRTTGRELFSRLAAVPVWTLWQARRSQFAPFGAFANTAR